VEQTLQLTRMNAIVPTFATVDEALAEQGSGSKVQASGG
jgi:hypothetical protein